MAHQELAPRYDASLVESKWYARWEEAGLFQPDPDQAKPVFSITIPPPNVTGSLHMGHALCFPVQDLMGRYRRLRGDSVLILPGTDHAGIATQMVVTKQLRAEGKTPADIGRDAFVERVWEWRRQSGDTILNQLRKLGCAFDWTRLRFTLDEGYHRAVLQVFIDWFERGIIYRGKRVVNWDPVLKTSVSDIETYRKDTRGKLYHVVYPFADGSGRVVIATTRPETMLADVAVAVHPADSRYKGLVGKMLLLPLMGREIPLITDEYPDPEFGTGAVKITPGHDPNDFEVGVRHGLSMPVVMDERARINECGGAYLGLDRYEARKKIVQDLQEQGFLLRSEDYDVPLLLSQRSDAAVEPLLSEEWFARMDDIAKPAIQVVRESRVRFTPDRYGKVYLDWMENLRDWNISRKLWWGHRVPVYYDADGTPYAAHSEEEAQRKAGHRKIVRQDDDVLDTWFSSALWPFATLGWPDKTEDLRRFYPTSLMVTASDILYLWVARMIMLGMAYRQEVPFHDIYIHATVLTDDGKRMSKSLGTGVDPTEVIEQKGADAMRFTLLSQAGMNQEIRYSDRRTEDARNFCNKIWNAARFVLMNLEGYEDHPPTELDPVDRWMLSRLHATEATTRTAYDGFDIQSAASHLYTFFWSEVCDWYIEVSKARLQDPDHRAAPQWVLVHCLQAFVTMLHPIMPHITEEIYQHLPLRDKSAFLMAASWPSIADRWADPEAERRVQRWFEITRALRSLRAEIDLPAMRQAPCAYVDGELDGGEFVVSSQAWIGTLRVGKPVGRHISTTIAGVDLHLPIEGLVDEAKELARLAREENKLQLELAKLEERLANPMFTDRAKSEVVERERASADELRHRLGKTRERRTLLQG